MGQVSAVFWDVGGVLLTNGWDHLQRARVLKQFALPREPFETVHAEWNDAWEKDHIGVDEYLQKTIFYEPRQFTPGDFLTAMKAESVILPNTAIEILKQVAAKDELAVVMLNNESRVLNDHRVETFGFPEYFDCYVSSCYVGLRKPHLEIYRMALDLTQREPEEVVFIDDRSENVAAANSLGILGIVHRTAQETAEALSRLGISVSVEAAP